MTQRRLTARLRYETAGLHRDAERAGGMGALLRGEIDIHQYAVMLRNLHALYAALESALERNADIPQVAAVRMPALYRAAPLAEDLRHLEGDGWDQLPLAEAMRSYVAHIEATSRMRPELLAAHAYVRYMGDLSGGQILRDVVRRALALEDDAGTAFYAFDKLGAPTSIKESIRSALDALPMNDQLASDLVAEARESFARHIRLFEELG